MLDDRTTNHGFLLDLLGNPAVLSGDYDTGWLDRRHVRAHGEPVRNADAALIQAALRLYEAEVEADRARFYAFARRGPKPAASRTVGSLPRSRLPLPGGPDRTGASMW